MNPPLTGSLFSPACGLLSRFGRGACQSLWVRVCPADPRSYCGGLVLGAPLSGITFRKGAVNGAFRQTDGAFR